jgi:hypothetical protein
MNAPPDLDWLARLREQLLAIEPDMATDEQLLFDTIDGQSEVIDQLRSIVRHGIEAEVFADALARHIKTLEQRRSRFEARSDACRSTVRNAMETLGLTALKAEDFTVSIVPGRPRVIVPDIDKLPPEYVRTKQEPNLIAIAAALKALPPDETFPGAHWGNTAPIIVVRRV